MSWPWGGSPSGLGCSSGRGGDRDSLRGGISCLDSFTSGQKHHWLRACIDNKRFHDRSGLTVRMMKIAYIARSLIPSRSANSIHVVKICHAFARIGHDVTLIVPATAENEQVTDAEIYRIYGVEGNFSIERVPDPLGSNEKRLWSWQAAGAAKRMEPDICYSRDLYASVFSCFLKIRTVHEFHHFKEDSEAQTILTRTRKRLSAISKGLSIFWSRRFEEYTGSSISSVLGFIRAGGYSQSARMMEKLFLSGNCVRIVAITQALEKDLATAFPAARGKILVAPDGADPPPSHLPEVECLQNSAKFRVGYCGHLYPGKGMEVIEKLVGLCPWASFHIVGGTDRDVAKWKAHLAENENIYFHGYVEPSAVASYINGFDVCLLANQPSVSTFPNKGKAKGDDIGSYTSPLKMFEYMSLSKPIVALNLGVLREILRDNVNSLLRPHDDAKSWAKALMALAEDEALRSSLAEQAQRDFLELYTWQARARRVLSFP